MLSTLAANYDIFQMNGPILNKARLHIHALQCNKEIGWDDKLDETCLQNWQKICRSVNNSPVVTIDRFVGERDEAYNLIVCTDASKQMYGAVLYIQSVATGSMSFLAAKNRIVGTQLQSWLF